MVRALHRAVLVNGRCPRSISAGSRLHRSVKRSRYGSYSQPSVRQRCALAGEPILKAEVEVKDVVDWLMDSDPAIRWQVMGDLVDTPEDNLAAERARVATTREAGHALSGMDLHRMEPDVVADIRTRSRRSTSAAGCPPGPRTRCVGARWRALLCGRGGALNQ